MNTTIVGLFTGLLLALAGIIGGFDGFLLALVLGTVGFVVGAQIDGRFDFAAMLSGRRRG